MICIYLDNCAIQRPLDDQRFVRIRLEAEAVVLLLSLFEAAQPETALLVSEISVIENNKNSDPVRKAFGAGIIARARERVVVDDANTKRAQEWMTLGVHAFDALHLACAEAARADYFCTCDDKLIKKAQHTSTMSICTPLTCVEKLI